MRTSTIFLYHSKPQSVYATELIVKQAIVKHSKTTFVFPGVDIQAKNETETTIVAF